ncbi:Fanconi anemia group E protein [Takifugu flavidus]|uniref:Fanconi anemia group E protein n=1 Tax=Takifugu flavidus TaxID=433684 RepID=A0A5C6MMW9_9TELE|nr:Fanconi anemia group E protein [Takifugu flavidus]TWW56594.1 Fanconi anemia group E protein [Takifugu flavidus]
MELRERLRKLDGQSKLLLRALVSGPFGAHKALTVFHRQQRANPGVSILNLIKTLCRDEVTSETKTQQITIKPLVCLFPTLFKQNLLTFISLVHRLLPQTAVRDLLVCLRKEPHRSPWVSALISQLERNIGVHSEEPLCTPICSQRIKQLSQQFVSPGGTRGWADYFGGFVKGSGTLTNSLEQGAQKKRRSSQISLDSDEDETVQQRKRSKMDACRQECVDAAEQNTKEDTPEKLQSVLSEGTDENIQPATDSESLIDALPQHMKNAVLQIKEVLESETDWDQSSVDVFKVLNECDPIQVEMLCNMLCLSDLPEQTLPKLCSTILAPSNDLSYITATKFIKSLLLKKVLSLSEPASRSLVTAGTSLCSRYPRPMCQAVILPVLEDKNIGNPHSELLNRLIECCLDSHYRLLVLQMTFKIAWNEAVISIIHCTLDSKPDVSEELFTQLTEQLLSQGPQFTKSVKFAKMMLTVLTKYSTSVTATHKQSLHSCLLLNETFLKKSLQAALKRITPP